MAPASPLLLGHTPSGHPHTWAPTPGRPHLALIAGAGAGATTWAAHLVAAHLAHPHHRAEIITHTPAPYAHQVSAAPDRARVWTPGHALGVAGELAALAGDVADLATTTGHGAPPPPVRALLVVDSWALVWGRRELRGLLEHLRHLATHGPRVGLHLVVRSHQPPRGLATDHWSLATSRVGPHVAARLGHAHPRGVVPRPPRTVGRWAVSTPTGWQTITAPAPARAALTS
ncbi:hypothetical protein [Nocardiopsis sp. NPDC006938]|uniref:hypothetical protein n=1 Tax=Nocardiopsis sp. NPDC006938 TaxID=3364337 RepID=UPI0036B1A5C1